jgi:MFS family permease
VSAVTEPQPEPQHELRSSRSWRDLSVRFAVGLAFADASIVVLALPQIVGQLDTTISHVTWVIMAYNLALIGGVLAFMPLAHRLSSRRALLAGIGLFGLASIGCGVAQSLEVLVAMRCVQGVGGALLLCSSLPLLAGAARGGRATSEWAAAAAIGAAVGPAAGGLLTQAFDWRAIFIAQAPAAAIAAAAVVAVPVRSFRAVVDEPGEPSVVTPVAANTALLLLSAGLIGALFLSVVLLIDVWQVEPAGAAVIVSAIPLATVLTQRLARGRSPLLTGAAGAALLAVGLAGLALVPHRELGWMVVALALCGAGLGFSFTTLTASAMGGPGSATVRAGRTVAARDAGLVVGLLVLTPIFVHDLDAAPKKALPKVASTLFASPLDNGTKLALGVRMLAIYNRTPGGQLPDLDPAFAATRQGASPQTRAALGPLQTSIEGEIERVVTHSFRRSLLFSAVFALLVLPVLTMVWVTGRRRRGPPAGEASGDAPGEAPAEA